MDLDSHQMSLLTMNNSPEEDTAAQLINLGVAHYEFENFDEAIIAFSEALTISKKVLELVGEEDTVENMFADDSAATPFQPQFGRSEMELSGNSDLFIFLNPIMVTTRLPRTKLYKTLTLITMFNLAICHHRNAIKNNMNEVSLRIALQLYELAYAIQMHNVIDMTLTPTMIIMSNVGQIHKILGNDVCAQQCFQHLLSTLMFLVDVFLGNILSTIYCNSPAAAA
jgi:hypothetical protein